MQLQASWLTRTAISGFADTEMAKPLRCWALSTAGSATLTLACLKVTHYGLPFGAFALQPVEVAAAGIVADPRIPVHMSSLLMTKTVATRTPDHIHSHKVATFTVSILITPRNVPRTGGAMVGRQTITTTVLLHRTVSAHCTTRWSEPASSPRTQNVLRSRKPMKITRCSSGFHHIRPLLRFTAQTFSRSVIKRCWLTEPRLTRRVSSSRSLNMCTQSAGRGRITRLFEGGYRVAKVGPVCRTKIALSTSQL